MTLGKVIEQAAGRKPELTALICGESSLSYSALDRNSSSLAHWFAGQGLHTGDRVAFYWSNSIETVTLLFGLWKAGLVAVPVNVRLKAAELAYVLDHSGSALCSAPPDLAAVVREAVESRGLSTKIETGFPDLAYSAQTLPHVSESDLCVIVYTSGTTAQPKGVAHTHRSLLAGVSLMLAMIGDPGPVILVTTQIAHVSGLICFLLPALLSNQTAVLLSAFDPAKALDHIERFGVTYTGALPAMITQMMREQESRPRDVRTLRVFIGGGDSVTVVQQQSFAAQFGLPILELLAMTESCPMCWNLAHDLRPGSVGKARAGVEFKIVDLDGTEGNSGELFVRSPANFREYWRDAEATAAVLNDRWLRTGDLVRRDAEGYLHFTGRHKNIIIRGGCNIAPPEVEDALCQHPAVREAAVTGLPDPVFGQKVAAFLVLREGFSLDADELRAFLRARLSDYKVPEEIRFMTELPKGLTGKIDRRALAELASSAKAASAT